MQSMDLIVLLEVLQVFFTETRQILMIGADMLAGLFTLLAIFSQ